MAETVQKILIGKAADPDRTALRSVELQNDRPASLAPDLEGVLVELEDVRYCFSILYGGRQCHVWSYRVQIRNFTSGPVKLLSRNWKISDIKDGALSDVTEIVRAMANAPHLTLGGQQPLLPPGGGSFSYEAGIALSEEAGMLQGWYDAQTIEAEDVRVKVGKTYFNCPRSVDSERLKKDSCTFGKLTPRDAMRLIEIIGAYNRGAEQTNSTVRLDFSLSYGLSSAGLDTINRFLIWNGRTQRKKVTKIKFAEIMPSAEQNAEINVTDHYMKPLPNGNVAVVLEFCRYKDSLDGNREDLLEADKAYISTLIGGNNFVRENITKIYTWFMRKVNDQFLKALSSIGFPKEEASSFAPEVVGFLADLHKSTEDPAKRLAILQHLRQRMAESAKEVTAVKLPDRAPELYKNRPIDPNTGKREEIDAFLARVWLDPWIKAGVLTRTDFRRLDPQGEARLANWLLKNTIPRHLYIPTKSESIEAVDETTARKGWRLGQRFRRQVYKPKI